MVFDPDDLQIKRFAAILRKNAARSRPEMRW
jgi:hypothetical protein